MSEMIMMNDYQTHALLTSNKIKLEPPSETDIVQSSTREVIHEDPVFDKMNLPASPSVKIECEQPEPEVYIDNPDNDDMKIIQPCSQDCPSLQEQSQMEKKMMFGKIDWKLVKQEKQNVLCEDTSHGYNYNNKLEVMTTCNNIQQMTELKTESRMHENRTALVHHQEVSLMGTENGYTASQHHEESSHMSESMSSMAELKSKLSLTNDNCQLRYEDIPVKHTHISGTSFGYTVNNTICKPQKIQSGNTPHMPDVCDVIINAKTVSFLHRHKIDIQENPYKCDICIKYFNNVNMLKCHMRTHTGEKSYSFDICGASFSCNGGMKRHMKLPTEEKRHKCEVCGASFSHKGDLKCHMRTHTGEKPYTCDICAASFSRNGHLKRHMRIHIGEKPYKCDTCDASFTKAAHLKCHIRAHTGEKPYKCDVCGASFTKSSGLKYHMRTHTEVKPYMCDNCGASFTQSGSPKYHMRSHTGERPYKCDICGESFTLVI
ncbi:hypothetical protein BsWGS_15743 [Bradybaena similaris]